VAFYQAGCSNDQLSTIPQRFVPRGEYVIYLYSIDWLRPSKKTMSASRQVIP
jgi:hypothetical protein